MKGILCISTYPPRECGIATFSDDLIRSVHQKFHGSYRFRVCALESAAEQHTYPPIVKYTFNTSDRQAFGPMAETINRDTETDLVLIEHEFGLFYENPAAFVQFLKAVSKPSLIVFHTVLSRPDATLRRYLRQIARACTAIIVMTQHSSGILQNEYGIRPDKINVIPHGTHLVAQQDKKTLKDKYGTTGRKVLTTFGLLSAGKSIETTIEALLAIIRENPMVLFLVIGKTHPSVAKTEGEQYRDMLKSRIRELGIGEYVRFVNAYLELPVLLEYLQLTDLYLFTSGDPNQAVSGTFVYAMSCGCPIISTPIPHALELFRDHSGVLFDFKKPAQLSAGVNRLLANPGLRSRMRIAGLQKIMATAWENSAISHVRLFRKIAGDTEELHYSLPPVNLSHIRRMSQGFGILQFSKGNRPDSRSGYTLDDNARALVAMCREYALTKDDSCLKYIRGYLNFIGYCLQPDGSFLNYVDKDRVFTEQNRQTELNDCTGRTIGALGCFIFSGGLSPVCRNEAVRIVEQALPALRDIRSPRSIAFAVKGLYFYNRACHSPERTALIALLAARLADYYQRTSVPGWNWFEETLNYDNSALPEALLYAYLDGGEEAYRKIAKESFDFLLAQTYSNHQIRTVSNRGWKRRGEACETFGEQPVDIANTVVTLSLFYEVFRDAEYLVKQRHAFNWFLGDNHLHQIIYNPATGGCYDGLEEHNVNMNQGAESAVCYLMARLEFPC